MKNNKVNKQSNNNATAALAEINAQIEALKQQRVGLAEPLKLRFTDLRAELTGLETQIRELDSTWRPTPKVDDKIAELIAANGPMTEAEIIAAVAGSVTKWKVRQTLKKKFSADAGGKYSVKA